MRRLSARRSRRTWRIGVRRSSGWGYRRSNFIPHPEQPCEAWRLEGWSGRTTVQVALLRGPRCARAPQRLCWPSSVLPFSVVPEDSIEDGEELSGDCDESALFGLSGRPQAMGEGRQGRIAAHRSHCRHEQRGPHAASSTADEALAAPLAGLTGKRCKPCQRRDLTAIERA